MFLHSGASLHGHEYSNRPASTSPLAEKQRRTPLLRTALNPLARHSQNLERQSLDLDAEKPHPPPVRRPFSVVYPRPLYDVLYPSRSRTPQPESRSDSSAQSSPVVRFKEPERIETPEPQMSEDEPTFYDSDASQSTTVSARRKKRREPRKSNVYLVAVPAPRRTAKKQILTHLRPKLLMQLQQISCDKRPRPTIDVFPASLIAGPLIAARYIRRFPRLFGIKGELGLHDIVLVKSEDYDSAGSSSDSDEDNFERRELVAILSPLPREDKAEIVLADGSVWVATPLASGSYDFVHTDAYGNTTTARWAKRPASSSSSAKPALHVNSANPLCPLARSQTPPLESDYRYTFSLINPLSRRHPVLATLTPTALEIQEDYTTVSSSQGRYPPTRPLSRNGSISSSVAASLASDPAAERTTYPVDEATKNLITVTSLWLVLRVKPVPEQVPEQVPTPPVEAPVIPPSPSITGACPIPTLPKRASTTTPPALSAGLPRRTSSSGAAFMQRRLQRQQQQQQQQQQHQYHPQLASDLSDNEEGGVPLQQGLAAPAAAAAMAGTTSPAQKQKRRLSWFRKLTH